MIRQFLALGVPAPILKFTVMEGEFYEAASLDAGADDFILKSASIPTIVSHLRAQIRSHEQCLGKKTELETVSI